MAKTLQVWMHAYTSLYTEAGLTVTEAMIIEKSWGNLARGPANFGIENPDEFWKKIIARVKEGVKTVSLYDGVKETLLVLKEQNARIAIVTSSERSLVEPALKYHGLDTLIDVLVTEEDVSKPKPDPEILFVALRKLNADKVPVVVVGDTGKDILAGKNAGIDSILICHQENEQFYNFRTFIDLDPTRVIQKFSDIISVST